MNGGDSDQQQQRQMQQQQWVAMQQYQQWWMAVQYPAMVMQQQQMMYNQHYLPYYHHQQQPKQHTHKHRNQIQASGEDNKTIWIGDLRHWMDEDYLHSCFSQSGEVLIVLCLVRILVVVFFWMRSLGFEILGGCFCCCEFFD